MLNFQAFCLDWHVDHSPSYRDILVEPLKEKCKIELETWDGNELDTTRIKDEQAPLLFCLFLPPQNYMARSNLRLLWIPMWDQVGGYPLSWWNNSPKSLRIVAFSQRIEELALANDLNVLRLKYYKDPRQFSPAKFDRERTLFYRNRVGLVSPRFLEKFCTTLHINKNFFRSQIDPLIDQNLYFKLPARLGNTLVEEIPGMLSRDRYLAIVNQANMFIAPCFYEGVGVSFLEALARDCALFSSDSPTMNEYMVHKETGYFLKDTASEKRWVRRVHKLQECLYKRLTRGKTLSRYMLSDNQDWRELGQLDLERLGHNSRLAHVEGHASWHKSLSDYARFILEW